MLLSMMMLSITPLPVRLNEVVLNIAVAVVAVTVVAVVAAVVVVAVAEDGLTDSTEGALGALGCLSGTRSHSATPWSGEPSNPLGQFRGAVIPLDVTLHHPRLAILRCPSPTMAPRIH